MIWAEPQEMKALKDEYYQKLHCSSLKISFLSPYSSHKFYLLMKAPASIKGLEEEIHGFC